ncbi:MAG TPA: group II truncated hemoglobin [Caulobacteraceae bacterium]|nr:group II truncated hemoglobin [Caulobacteraceae bacterium]
MTADVLDRPQETPFDQIGGAAVVRRVVDRFYDLMDGEGEFAPLRALHAPELDPMRASLAGFLTAWLGGPRDWFEQRPGVCMMSAHAAVPVTRETAAQWIGAMSRALADEGVEARLRDPMIAALSRMAQVMALR